MSLQIPGVLQSWRIPARRTWLCATLSALVLAGCAESGPDVAPVTGRVTLDGQPMVGARLMFQPEAVGGSPSYGTTDGEGRYTLGYKRGQPGAMPGWHSIRIEAGAGQEGSEGKATPALPARYNAQSELRREVKADEDNTVDFDLTSETK